MHLKKKASGLCNPKANYKFEKMNFGLHNPEYYRGTFLEI